MICPLCKGNLNKGKTTLTIEFEHENIITIYNIPVLICSQCGEEYFTPQISEEIEKLKNDLKKLKIKMGFVKFNEAA